MDRTIVKFIMVGVLNTLFGAAIMFGLYNLAGCGYWVSSAANYICGSVLSFVLNKYFTFRNHDTVRSTAPRFVVNILVCYFVAYGVAKPLVHLVFGGLAPRLADNAAMLLGMVVFTALNYLGQRFFAFRER